MKYAEAMPPVPPNPSLQATPVPGAPELERYVSATISPIRSKRREVAMRTALIIAVGFVLWAACLGVAKLLASARTSSMITATVAFVVIWCVAAAANMWIGVSHAGYSFREELPIFLLIFVLPAAVAMFVVTVHLCNRVRRQDTCTLEAGQELEAKKARARRATPPRTRPSDNQGCSDAAV
jgi:hypothetical protein